MLSRACCGRKASVERAFQALVGVAGASKASKLDFQEAVQRSRLAVALLEWNASSDMQVELLYGTYVKSSPSDAEEREGWERKGQMADGLEARLARRPCAFHLLRTLAAVLLLSS